MKKKNVVILSILLVVVTAAVTWLVTGGWSSFMPPISASLPQNSGDYGPEEQAVLDASQRFWTAMEGADEVGMRAVADPNCTFVHIGMTCKLDEEIRAYTEGMFQPTEIVFHGQSVERYGDTAIVLTDCDYSLKLGGMNTTHHFAVTEVYVQQEDQWRLVQFSFTALTS